MCSRFHGVDLGASFQYPKHSSSPLTNVRNGFKSFLSLHIFLLFPQWRVYIFSTPPLQLFMYGARDFPASFPSRYSHKSHSLVRHYSFMAVVSVLARVKND